MVTLTPEEAREYHEHGPIAAIKAYRYRTNLSLTLSKRAIDMWAANGKPIAEDGKPNFESVTMEKLSEALTRLKEAERTITDQRRRAMEITFRVAFEVNEFPEDQRETWMKACHAVRDALGKEL